ncbi:hypothetical protein Misp01_38240 [Microtetraspora sp. NBRC 13810]|nr:hypothetical protein Misp01_38240 [Microtetraspora sp. NBRC 13810]
MLPRWVRVIAGGGATVEPRARVLSRAISRASTSTRCSGRSATGSRQRNPGAQAEDRVGVRGLREQLVHAQGDILRIVRVRRADDQRGVEYSFLALTCSP